MLKIPIKPHKCTENPYKNHINVPKIHIKPYKYAKNPYKTT